MILWGFILICLFIWKRCAIKNFFGDAFPKDFRYLIVGLIFGAIGGIIGGIYDLQGRDRAHNSDEVVAVAAIAGLALILLTAVAMLFRKNKPPRYWGRFAFNSIFFAVAFFPGVFIGMIGVWFGIVVILGAFVYFGVFAKGASGIFGGMSDLIGGGASNNSASSRCCGSCTCFSNHSMRCTITDEMILTPTIQDCSEYKSE
ncbi:MAG: hypothetical protein LBB53_06540 [Prevotellaceae bacterium]|jgi:hypothetical protein|nr:hypothetical protein [Prevotellaceae bacterium]